MQDRIKFYEDSECKVELTQDKPGWKVAAGYAGLILG